MRESMKRRVAVAMLWAGMLGASAVVVLGPGPATAHQQGPKLHLADAPPDQQVEAVTYCDSVYRVVIKEGAPIEFREFDLRLKTDGSPDGPAPGTPVLIKAGMRGDRAFVIFSAPGEISPFIKNECRGA